MTAFEPFGGASGNPSMDVVAGLAQQWHRPERLVTAVLPVSFAGARSELDGLLGRYRPDVVVSVGLAGARSRPELERVALNLADAPIPDNDGDQPIDRAVVPGAPLALVTTLPVKAAAAAATADGVRVGLSTSAGTYVCNAVMFHGARWAAQDTSRRAGFLHVPGECVAGSTVVLRHAVDAALDHAGDDGAGIGDHDAGWGSLD